MNRQSGDLIYLSKSHTVGFGSESSGQAGGCKLCNTICCVPVIVAGSHDEETSLCPQNSLDQDIYLVAVPDLDSHNSELKT